jgi:hypothetical protein
MPRGLSGRLSFPSTADAQGLERPAVLSRFYALAEAAGAVSAGSALRVSAIGSGCAPHTLAPIKIAPTRIDASALKVPVNWALLALPVGRHRIN